MLEIYSREARHLIDQAVRRVLSTPGRPFGRNSVASGGMFYLAKTDGDGLTARNALVVGQGTCTLQTIGGSNSIEAQTDESGEDVTVTAWNISTETLPGDSYTFLVQDILSGRYWAVWEDCPTS